MCRHAGLALMLLVFLVFGRPPAAGSAAIHDAVSRGDLVAIETLVKGDPSILQARNEAALTPFLLAADSGQVAAAELLLTLGSDLDESDNEHSNALHLAASKNRADMVTFLLARGMDVNGADDNGMTAVLFAAGRGSVEMVKRLVGQGARLDARTRGGTSVAHFAAYAGRVELLDFCFANGVPLDMGPDQYGNTPVMAAIWRNRGEAFRYLLEKGADLQATGGEGRTAAHQAAARGSLDVLRVLAEKGSDLNVRDESGGTPLMEAVLGPQPGAVAYLLEHGADPRLANQGGWTPLHFLPSHGDTALAALLLAHGADPNAATATGNTPLAEAVQHGARRFVEMFLDNGGDVRAIEPQFGRNLLHTAAAAGYGDVVALLVARGAEVNARTSGGETPLDLAWRHGNHEVAKSLKAKGAKAHVVKERAASDALARKVKPGEAIVWYLGHAGWVVETARNVLVLDYFYEPSRTDEPSLLNGHIRPWELAGLAEKKVTVFASHEHTDHYNRAIFAWRDALPGLTYVLGFEPDTTVACERIQPHETRVIQGVEVTAIQSTDAGVGFVISADGVKIFHPGDHANSSRELPNPYSAEIDYAVERMPGVDIAFIPVTGCGFNDLEALKAGIYYAVETLQPRVVFPMHAIYMEHAYRDFAQEAKGKGCQVPMGCAEMRGDRFLYRGGKLVRL